MRKTISVVALILLSLLQTNCAKLGQDSLTGNLAQGQDSISYIVESSVATVSSALNDSEKVSSYALFQKQKKSSFDFLNFLNLTNANAASCSLARFSPAIGTLNCSGTVGNKTVKSVFSSCSTSSVNNASLNGTVTLTFDTSGTCDNWISAAALPSNGYVIRTSPDFTSTNPNGSNVLTDSTPHSNYSGATVGGGVKTSFGNGLQLIDVLGVTRSKTTSAGATVFNHSVYTTTPLMISGLKSTNNRQIISGVVRVDHNLSSYSSTVSMAGLSWTTSCCYPTNGSLTFNVTGTLAGSLTANFNTGVCGNVSISDTKGNAIQLLLSSCE